jgi:hypothetical protein
MLPPAPSFAPGSAFAFDGVIETVSASTITKTGTASVLGSKRSTDTRDVMVREENHASESDNEGGDATGSVKGKVDLRCLNDLSEYFKAFSAQYFEDHADVPTAAYDITVHLGDTLVSKALAVCRGCLSLTTLVKKLQPNLHFQAGRCFIRGGSFQTSLEYVSGVITENPGILNAIKT